jgi:hypothetical protein
VPSHHFRVLKECSYFLPRAFTSIVVCFGDPEKVCPEEGEGKEEGRGEGGGIKFKKDE